MRGPSRSRLTQGGSKPFADYLSVATGIGWVMLYLKIDSGEKMGQAVGNIVSEWTQILG